MKKLKRLQAKYEKIGKQIEKLKSEQKYPIYCRDKVSDYVVKFNGLNSGVVVKQGVNGLNVGFKSDSFVSHTDTDWWQELDACRETGFFDGQLVIAQKKELTHVRLLCFYDAKNKCVFDEEGNRDGISIILLSLKEYKGNYPLWALNSFSSLKR